MDEVLPSIRMVNSNKYFSMDYLKVAMDEKRP
jgi:hypothetical protein